jgi:hypothetical protein
MVNGRVEFADCVDSGRSRGCPRGHDLRGIGAGVVLGVLALALLFGSGSPAWGQEGRSLADVLLRWDAPEGGDGAASEEREEFIETDRNSFTFAPFPPGAGRLVVESAYSFLDIGDEGVKHSFPEAILRYGIGDRFELRLGYNIETGPESESAEGDIAGNFGINAEQQVLYGFKYQISRQRAGFRLMPHSAFFAQAHTPISSIEDQSQIRLGYVWGWILPNGWTFDSAFRFGTDREHEDGYTIWAPSTVLRIPIGAEKRWFTHVEYFGIMSQARERDFSKHFVDTGLHYFITPNFEVGGIIAFGINEQSRGIIANTGFGIRF